MQSERMTETYPGPWTNLSLLQVRTYAFARECVLGLYVGRPSGLDLDLDKNHWWIVGALD